MTPHHVLFVEANEDGSVGGSHQVLYDMVRAFDPSRVQATVLFYQDNRFATLFEDAGIRVVRWDAVRDAERAVHRSGRRLRKIVEVGSGILRRRDFLRSAGIDLVHMNNSPRTGRDDWLPAARLAGVPIVASARGDADPLPGRGLRSAVHRALMRRFDRVISVSEYIAASMRAQGIAPERVLVVHDGVDRTKLDRLGARSAAEIREDLHVPAGKVFVAMVGNVREWKGQHVVIEALGSLSVEDRDRLFVVFVGAVRNEDRSYLAALERRASELGVEGMVRFEGSRTDVPEIMSVADVMVHASVIPEPGGTVVIESMTFGAPVVVASKGGHLDYLEGDLGFVHDVEQPTQLAAHLRTLAADPKMRARMAEQARSRASLFSIQRTAAKMTAVYEDLLR